eukprot:CAMPEP_0206589116 /NCGR_PEP_ID=MMETSP0325_2-20121206/38714_1 /ASSEMBLY_ACC=CAM_ASM_000347 /TAXON_ID=2866 /ORGANISM="Crypthecodinium cohnii, Strain Seligo" /LENGTH=513 /DNA_ID=CAMNT_0054097579 /DNA_START=195 /DNA_END=1732 /DNA_ORIENTATION=+
MEDHDPILDEVRERFMLKKLEERCWRLEAENKDLKTNNFILSTQYNSQRETQSEILRQLNQTIVEQGEKLDKAEERKQQLLNQLEDQKREYEGKLEAERLSWEGTVKGLQAQCEELRTTLNEVREFQRQKDFLESELARLKKELQDQAQSHTEAINNLERTKTMEREQMIKETNRNVRETIEMLRAKTKEQLDQTTKRTILENEQKTTELHFQSKEVERLLNSNNKLVEENSQLRRNLQIHKDLENELAKRTHVYQKLIKRMEQKQKSELAAREQSQLLESQSRTDVSRELPSVGPTQQSAENDALKRQLERNESYLATVRHEFAQYKRDHATLTQLQDQSTRLIISALYELKNQREADVFPPPGYDENADWQFANMTGKQKEYFFRVLLEKLNSSMCGSCFPTGPSAQPSTTSLPAIHRPTGEAKGHFSQFLWSVATHGGQATQGSSGKDVVSKSVQTDTTQSDPCMKEGMWNPASRKHFSGGAAMVTPDVVAGGVRSWGPRAVSQKPRGIT